MVTEGPRRPTRPSKRPRRHIFLLPIFCICLCINSADAVVAAGRNKEMHSVHGNANLLKWVKAKPAQQ
eukprot:4772588-Alexandrium_andersonii.AAC.1